MKRVIAALFILLMALSINAPAALAVENENEDPIVGVVPTIGVISGGNNPGEDPFIKYKWELPDDCHFKPCVQVTPVPSPPIGSGIRKENCYIVASDNNGANDVQSVFIMVYHPDGSFKYKIHARKLDEDNVDDNDKINEAVKGAYQSGHLTLAEVEEILWEIEKDDVDMWVAEFDLHSHQPAGTYTVMAYAADTAGHVSAPMVNYFCYISIKVLYIDFENVDFGPIVPCQEQIVPGDEDLSTPDKPTVKNCGNDNVWILVHFTAMTGKTYLQKIENFDAKFRGQKLYLNACEIGGFCLPALPCTPTQIDFSVHAPLGLVEDSYEGCLTIGIKGTPPENCDD